MPAGQTHGGWGQTILSLPLYFLSLSWHFFNVISVFYTCMACLPPSLAGEEERKEEEDNESYSG